MSTPDQYLPRADSLPHRVCSYFARLPDEELSNKDIALKWQCDPKNILVQLSQAVAAGILARDGMVYTAGPNISRMNESVPLSTPFRSGDRSRLGPSRCVGRPTVGRRLRRRGRSRW